MREGARAIGALLLTMLGSAASGPLRTAPGSRSCPVGRTRRRCGSWKGDRSSSWDRSTSPARRSSSACDVELLPDGGLAVANQGSEELRIFGADGALPGIAGGKGHGPEEFDGLSMVESFGDSLLTWDGGNQRLSVRGLDGTLVRTFALEWFDGILFPVDLLGAAGIAGERSVLAVTARYMSQLQGSGLVVDTAWLPSTTWRAPSFSTAGG